MQPLTALTSRSIRASLALQDFPGPVLIALIAAQSHSPPPLTAHPPIRVSGASGPARKQSTSGQWQGLRTCCVPPDGADTAPSNFLHPPLLLARVWEMFAT